MLAIESPRGWTPRTPIPARTRPTPTDLAILVVGYAVSFGLPRLSLLAAARRVIPCGPAQWLSGSVVLEPVMHLNREFPAVSALEASKIAPRSRLSLKNRRKTGLEVHNRL